MKARLSRRLRLIVFVMRHVMRPLLARYGGPKSARRAFRAIARGFLPPAGVRHTRLPSTAGTPAIHRIACAPWRADRVILYFHGGAYMVGSPRTHAALMGRIAQLVGCEVVAPAYRIAPEHPAPAAFDDACGAHRVLVAEGWAPGQIVLAGDSAGGGLALALLADLGARQLSPAGCLVFSPWTDLAMGGQSLVENAVRDPVIPPSRMAETVEKIRGALDPRDPRVSPLYAAFLAPPPVFIQVGTDEVLRDDSRRIAAQLRAAGGRVVLEEWAGVPHVWQILDGWVPEARQALVSAARFVNLLQPEPA